VLISKGRNINRRGISTEKLISNSELPCDCMMTQTDGIRKKEKEVNEMMEGEYLWTTHNPTVIVVACPQCARRDVVSTARVTRTCSRTKTSRSENKLGCGTLYYIPTPKKVAGHQALKNLKERLAKANKPQVKYVPKHAKKQACKHCCNCVCH